MCLRYVDRHFPVLLIYKLWTDPTPFLIVTLYGFCYPFVLIGPALRYCSGLLVVLFFETFYLFCVQSALIVFMFALSCSCFGFCSSFIPRLFPWGSSMLYSEWRGGAGLGSRRVDGTIEAKDCGLMWLEYYCVFFHVCLFCS